MKYVEHLKVIALEPAKGPSEVMVAIYILAFAAPLFRLEVLANYPTYAQMNRMAPGYMWGLGLCGLALIRIVTVVRQSYHGRVGTTALSIFSWLLLFLSFLLAQKWHPGVTVFASWALMDTWTLFRIQR